MLELRQKDIRNYQTEEGTRKVWDRIKAYQKAHNTTGLDSARAYGFEVVGRSYGIYGANGTLLRDLETGELIGIAQRDDTIYL